MASIEINIVLASWIAPLAERIGKDIKYCVVECGMTEEEASQMIGLQVQLLWALALREPVLPKLKQLAAQKIYDEITHE